MQRLVRFSSVCQIVWLANNHKIESLLAIVSPAYTPTHKRNWLISTDGAYSKLSRLIGASLLVSQNFSQPRCIPCGPQRNKSLRLDSFCDSLRLCRNELQASVLLHSTIRSCYISNLSTMLRFSV